MSKLKARLNSALCIGLMALMTYGLYGAIQDFHNAKNGLALLKALFWMAIFVAAFWIDVGCLLTKKPIWRIWE